MYFFSLILLNFHDLLSWWCQLYLYIRLCSCVYFHIWYLLNMSNNTSALSSSVHEAQWHRLHCLTAFLPCFVFSSSMKASMMWWWKSLQKPMPRSALVIHGIVSSSFQLMTLGDTFLFVLFASFCLSSKMIIDQRYLILAVYWVMVRASLIQNMSPEREMENPATTVTVHLGQVKQLLSKCYDKECNKKLS